jgi:hypothetical protein
MALGTGRQQAGDNGVFHGIAGCPGIPAHHHIAMLPADRQSRPECQSEKVFIKNGAYTGGSEKPHNIIILLLCGQMSTK